MGIETRPAILTVRTKAALTVPAQQLSRSEEEILQELQAWRQPVFKLPYPMYGQNPLAPVIYEPVLAWFYNHNLQTIFTRDEDLDFLMACRLHEVPTMVYSFAGEEGLLWIAKFVLWLFVLDDLCEERDSFYSAEQWSSLFVEISLLMMSSFPNDDSLRTAFLELLPQLPEHSRQQTVKYVEAQMAKAKSQPGASVYDSPTLGPVGCAYRDLWVELLERIPRDTVKRWGLTIQWYLIANAKEVNNRKNEYVMSVAEYIPHRRLVSALDPCYIGAVDLIEGLHTSLPDDIFNGPVWQELFMALNDIISWHNDLWSFKKEIVKGGMQNMVFIISKETGCSFSEASHKTMDMLYKRIEELQTLFDEMERITPLEYKKHVDAYIKSAKLWITGTHNFHYTNIRFKV